MWGWFADQHGRKKAMILMNMCNNCCFLLTIVNFFCIFFFGISKNYYFTLVIRLIHGLADGTLVINKTMISELSNSRNISLGTSFIFVGGFVGRVLGPLFSSYLTDKNVIAPLMHIMPFLNDVCFCFCIKMQMPFLLPFSVVALIQLIAVVSFVFFSEDTITPEELETAKECKNQMKVLNINAFS